MTRILVVDDDRTTRHLLGGVLTKAGFKTTVAKDGAEALEALRHGRFDLMLLDVWMPKLNGLELLEHIQTWKRRPRVVVMTSDDAPQTLLEAVRQQAFRYIHKPVEPLALLQTVRQILKAPDVPPIEVVSARPEWVELVVPCTREAVERIQDVLAQLESDLSAKLRESTAFAFRELLLNAIEWGGQLDPTRTVRIACLRSARMLLYRIADPGPGFSIDQLPHAAIGRKGEGPVAHMADREEQGIRPGGFGLLMVTASADELLYNEKRNEVVFIKYLTEPSADSSG
jgi:CheY-like chemotaxis protein/anti-sigma regulatory factor (Ser/Thr protein kinase)